MSKAYYIFANNAKKEKLNRKFDMDNITLKSTETI